MAKNRDNKAQCATLTALFAGTWYREEGAEGDCALQIPSIESLFLFSCVVLNAALHLAAGQPLACSQRVYGQPQRPQPSAPSPLQEGRKSHTRQLFFKGT